MGEEKEDGVTSPFTTNPHTLWFFHSCFSTELSYIRKQPRKAQNFIGCVNQLLVSSLQFQVDISVQLLVYSLKPIQ